MADDRCVDNYDTQPGTKVLTYECHSGSNQFFAFLKNGWIMTDNHDLCIGVSSGNSTATSGAIIVECSAMDKTQLWQFSHEVNKNARQKNSEFILQRPFYSGLFILARLFKSN